VQLWKVFVLVHGGAVADCIVSPDASARDTRAPFFLADGAVESSPHFGRRSHALLCPLVPLCTLSEIRVPHGAPKLNQRGGCRLNNQTTNGVGVRRSHPWGIAMSDPLRIARAHWRCEFRQSAPREGLAKRLVLARAFERTETWITNRLGANIVIVIVTVLVGGIVGNVVGKTTLAALIGALASLLLVVLGKFVLELARYRLSCWKDPIWGATCLQSGTPGMVAFGLDCKVQPPASIPDHLECAVKPPSGDVEIVPEQSLSPRRPLGVVFDFPLATPGTYEVRWYGLSDRRKRYEITRAKFKLPVVEP
jgi:hypothetical protein